MKRRLGSFVMLAALYPLAGGCNSVLGIKEHQLVDGGGGSAGGGGGTGGGDTGMAGAAGGSVGGSGTGGTATGSSCNADASVDGADAVDAATGPACGFTIPNPPGSGLPNPMDYIVNTDRTVYDEVTKLTWEGLVDNRTVPQEEAARYCASKPGGDWRLPTLLELISLVDFTVPMPGPTISADFPDRPTDYSFWTSSRAPCANKGWYVDFAKGDAHQLLDDMFLKVRCVRGKPANCPTTRYQPAGLGAIHDATTGLTWQQTVTSSQAKTWSEAATYCSSLGAGWRLPGPAELESIVDLTKEYPPTAPIDTDTFPGTPGAYFWTYAPAAGAPGYAWYVAFIHGHIDTTPVGSTTTFVRCVRWDGP
jgi:hypothetical protein